MRGKVLRHFLFISFGFVLLFAVFGLYWQYHLEMNAPLAIAPGDSNILHVKKGQGLHGISEELQQRHIIRYQWPLLLYGKIKGNAHELKSGDYRITGRENLRQLYHDILKGNVIIHSVTVVEGTTYAQLRKSLASAEDLRQTLKDSSDAEVAKKLGIQAPGLEGQFFPDTYYYTAQDSDLSLLKRMHERMNSVLGKAWAQRAPQLAINQPYQALIIASLIEKETRLENERPIISGVFQRRLLKKMRLQTDPSVMYGIKNFKGHLTRADLRNDTPYNTYTRYGLPPTPIALPGRASIEAAVHPDQGKSLYFVATGNGGHTFTESYDAHKKAVENYLEHQRRQK